MKQAIRVVHVIETLGHGGAEYALLALLPALRASGMEPSLVVLDGSSDRCRVLLPDFQRAGVPVTFLAAPGLVGKAREFQMQLRGQPVDIVHAHLTRSVLVAGWPGAPENQPPPVMVGSLHNMGYDKPVPVGLRLRHWVKKRLAVRAACRFDLWLAVSSAVQAHYWRHWRLPPERMMVVPNPVVTPLQPAHALGKTPDPYPPLIVLPGRLVPEKGHDFALELAGRFQQENVPLQWLFAGGGPLLENLQAQIDARGLRDLVQITGALSQSEMHQRMAEATVVIQPSWQEGFGMTAAEAMALGKAVLVSDAGGLPETVGDAGRIVPAGDYQAWQAALRYLLDSSVARHTLGQAAQDRVAQCFSLDAISRKYLQVYRWLLGYEQPVEADA